MTITLAPDQEKAIRDAIKAGLLESVDEFIETAIEALPHAEKSAPSRREAVRHMREFGETYRLILGEPVTRKLLHEGPDAS
jgi:Arc/MetJ-type ribon-helix-helix transcriptional regulator